MLIDLEPLKIGPQGENIIINLIKDWDDTHIEVKVDKGGGDSINEQTKILRFKEQLEDPNQSEEPVVESLQNLADMDITFQAPQETDIGRHVNGLRKHPSNEVRKLVKQLVRKWKETVDEWVKVNQPEASSNLIAYGDSPQQNMSKNQQNGHHQVLDFGYFPNLRSECRNQILKFAVVIFPVVDDIGQVKN